ncbi:unnamed protein product [Merluccius merluccius]
MGTGGTRVAELLLLALLALLSLAESLQMTVRPDADGAVRRVHAAQGSACTLCAGNATSPVPCDAASVPLAAGEEATLRLNCSETAYRAEVRRTVECTKDSCSPATGAVQASFLTQLPRNLTWRTFSWDVSLPKRTVLTLDFPAPGLKETTAKDACQGGHKYSFHTTSAAGERKEKTFCSDGPVAQLSFLGKTSLAVQVPPGGELDVEAFTAKAVPRKGRSVSVTLGSDTRLIFSRDGQEPECEVCVDQKCDPDYKLLRGPTTNTSVEFGCLRPQDLYRVEVNREMDCPTTCPENRDQTQSTLFPDFNRTFTLDLKVHPPSTRTVQMDFPKPGLRQVSGEETCPEGQTYSIVTYLRTGPARIGTYCRGGTLSTVQVRYKARLIQQVPGDRALDAQDFKLSVGPETDLLAIVKVDLPRGVSETPFSAANYPNNFPDDERMSWDVRVPGMHNYTVRLGDRRPPEECLQKRVELVYQQGGDPKKVTRLGLEDPQPQHKQGDFQMLLANCKTNQTLEGLALAFTVSVMRSGHPVLCTVDLRKDADLSLQIDKVSSDLYCEMSLDSVVRDNINMAAGTKAKLSFLDCPNGDLRLTASRLVACRGSRSCSLAESLLTVPSLDACLPMALHSFTWRVQVPENGTVDLSSPVPGGLRQSLPGQECNGSAAVMRLAEGEGDSGHPIGTFCQQGVIEKMQVHANVSITVVTQDIGKAKGPFLNVSITKEISEHIIYTVRPQIFTPTLLATPNWPDGMKPSSTVSWIVLVPSQHSAGVKFSNVTQPICDKWHTGIKVQPMGSKEEILSRREDEKLEDQLVSESFYLNMSNCAPASGFFSALTHVTVQPKNNLVGIILAVLGAVLLLVLVLVAVCLILKKKKNDKAAHDASIYIGKGNIFRTGDAHFAKARSDNASHIYDAIDETMVYGHLLRDSTYADDVPDHFNGMQVDSYRTFVGPVDGESATHEVEPQGPPAPSDDGFQTFLTPGDSFLPPRPRTPVDRQESLGFQDRRMVDNELYSFRSTGGFNTIRLSGADQQDDSSF